MSCSISKVSLERYSDTNGVVLGLFHSTPRISWRFSGEAKDWVQSSYDLRITRGGSKPEEYHVDSADSHLVPWPSQPLASREVVRIAVRATSKDGKSTGWKELEAHTALLERGDWKASVSLGPEQPEDGAQRPFHVRKTFSVKRNDKSQSTLYITALGLYIATINGKRVGDHCLAPGWQSYKHRLHYQTFDVGSLLKDGDNVIEAIVGDGWYAGRLGFHGGSRNHFGHDLGLIAQLEVDGQAVVTTGDDWEWAFGQLQSSEIYDGEIIDTTITPESMQWQAARSAPLPSTHLIAPEAPPVRRIMELQVEEIITTPSGKTILDFGQNLVGWCSINSEPATRTGTLTIKHAEVLEHGELGVRPLRVCKATDTIHLGGSVKGWEPTFTFHGFRYVQIEGWQSITKEDITAIVVHSDMERLGDFHCSHKMIDRFHQNTLWGARGNLVSVPTDCPQRDERLGWTGDLQAFGPTASFLFDTGGMLGNWLHDLAVEQIKDTSGIPPLVVPNVLKGMGPPMACAVWGDVASLTPYDLYSAYGDTRYLEEQYESMAAWIESLPKDKETGLWELGRQLGDWLDPKAPPDAPENAQTDGMLVADAYLVHTVNVASKTAAALGKTTEAKSYSDRYAKLLKAFQAEYISPNGRMVCDSQTAFALALRFHLFPTPEAEKRAADRLDWLVKHEGFKISTGFAGTPNILPALAAHGKLNCAYRMFQEKECPSLLYPVSMGATTIWERWDSMLPDGSINPGEMTSFNHYALGSVSEFLYEYAGGIKMLAPGWKKVLIHPRPGGSLTWAEVEHVSPYGKIRCAWQIKGDKLEVQVEVPPNSTAKVILPGVKEEVGSGKREYSVAWKADPEWPPKADQNPFRPPKPDEPVL